MVSIKPHRVIAKFTLADVENEMKLKTSRQPFSVVPEIQSVTVPIDATKPTIVEIEVAKIETGSRIFRAFKRLADLMGVGHEEGVA